MTGKSLAVRRLQAFETRIWNPWFDFRKRYEFPAGEGEYFADQAEEYLTEAYQALLAAARETEAARDLDADDAPVRRARSLHLR